MEKNLTLSQFPRQEINKLLTITGQSHRFQYQVRFLRKSYSTPFLNIFKKTIYFVTTNQAFDLLNHASFNYFPLLMTFMHHLIVNHLEMYEEFS